VIKLNSTVALGDLNALSQLKMAADPSNTWIIYVFRQNTTVSAGATNRDHRSPPDQHGEGDAAPRDLSPDNFAFHFKYERFRVAPMSCTVISPEAEGLTINHAYEIMGRMICDPLLTKDIRDLVAIYTIPDGATLQTRTGDA
jgi:hypothetical protein